MKIIKFLFLLEILAINAGLAAFNDQKMLNQIQTDSSKGTTPVAVFDLDETLVSSHLRKLVSYKEAAGTLSNLYPVETQVVQNMSIRDFMKTRNHYDSKEIFHANGILNDAFIKELDAKMLPIYLSSKYMDFDSEIPCATAFIRSLYSVGAMVVFVSSRYKSTQSKGTITSLTRIRMIRPGDHFRIILRPDGMSSIDFKKMAFSQIQAMKMAYGKPTIVRVVGENEPENMNAMIEAFPDAERVFVRGANLSHEQLIAPVQMIPNYCN